MTIAVACPSCKSKMQAPDKLAGKKVKCPKCGSPILVGGPAAKNPATEAGEVVGIDENVLAGLAVGTPEEDEGERLQEESAQPPVNLPAPPARPLVAPSQTACPHCRLPIAFNADVAGKQVICPHCKDTFPMPAAIPEQQALVDLLQRDVSQIRQQHPGLLNSIGRHRGLLIAIVVLLLLNLALTVLAAVRGTPALNPQWEYYTVEIRDSEFDEKMDRLGRQGWELAFARRATGKFDLPVYEVIFKRRR